MADHRTFDLRRFISLFVWFWLGQIFILASLSLIFGLLPKLLGPLFGMTTACVALIAAGAATTRRVRRTQMFLAGFMTVLIAAPAMLAIISLGITQNVSDSIDRLGTSVEDRFWIAQIYVFGLYAAFAAPIGMLLAQAGTSSKITFDAGARPAFDEAARLSNAQQKFSIGQYLRLGALLWAGQMMVYILIPIEGPWGDRSLPAIAVFALISLVVAVLLAQSAVPLRISSVQAFLGGAPLPVGGLLFHLVIGLLFGALGMWDLLGMVINGPDVEMLVQTRVLLPDVLAFTHIVVATSIGLQLLRHMARRNDRTHAATPASHEATPPQRRSTRAGGIRLLLIAAAVVVYAATLGPRIDHRYAEINAAALATASTALHTDADWNAVAEALRCEVFAEGREEALVGWDLSNASMMLPSYRKTERNDASGEWIRYAPQPVPSGGAHGIDEVFLIHYVDAYIESAYVLSRPITSTVTDKMATTPGDAWVKIECPQPQ